MKLKWSIFIATIVLWVCGATGLILHIYDTVKPPNQLLECVKTTLLLLGGLGVILPTYLSVWQSIEGNATIQQKIEFDKMENTFTIIGNWDNPALLKARALSREIEEKRVHITDEQLKQKISTDQSLKESVILIFNYWEDVRMSIKNKRVNEEALRHSMSAVFDLCYETYEAWIKTKSNVYQKDLLWLRNRWIEKDDEE